MHEHQYASTHTQVEQREVSRVLRNTYGLLAITLGVSAFVAYMAVQASQRRLGIARAMLQQMVARHPHAELACVAGKVATFEAMGFQVLAARGPQVLMSTRDHSANGMLAVQDLAPIFQSTEVRQIHAYLLKQHGKRAMSDAEKQRDRLLDQMAQQAQALVRERLTVH